MDARIIAGNKRGHELVGYRHDGKRLLTRALWVRAQLYRHADTEYRLLDGPGGLSGCDWHDDSIYNRAELVKLR